VKTSEKRFARWGSLFHILGLTAFLVIVFLPVFSLLAEAGLALVSRGPEVLSLAVPSAERMTLLLRSGLFSAATAGAAGLIAICAGSLLWRFQRKPLTYVRWLLLVLIVIPPYVHALSWMAVGDLLSDFSLWRQLSQELARGWIPAWWVQTMAHLPIAVGLTLVGLDTVDPSLVDAARAHRSEIQGFLRVVLPLSVPTLLAGNSFVFLLVLLDYSVPALFQVTSYPLAVFAEFSATHDSVRATAMAVPFLVIGLPVLVGAQRVIRKATLNPRRHRDTWTSPAAWPPWFSLLQWLGLLVLGLHLLVPLGSLTLLTGSIGAFGASIRSAGSEVAFSAGLCGATALLSLPLGLAVARHLGRRTRRSGLWWALVTIPLVIPAPLTGIGLIALWNRSGLGLVYSSDLMPLLAMLARFAPFAVLALYVELERQGPGLLDAARVFQKSSAHGLLRIRLPLLAPGVFAAAALVGGLSAGEVGSTLLVLPPGRSTLALRIYDYLHYGASETVAGLALTLFLLAFSTGLLASLALGARSRRVRPATRGTT